MGVGAKRTVDSHYGSHVEVWREVQFLAERATTPNKGLFLVTKNVLIICCICWENVFVLFIILLLCRLKKTHDKDTKDAFMLGPVSLVTNSLFLTLDPAIWRFCILQLAKMEEEVFTW